jgi:prephenate dehydrogenase
MARVAILGLGAVGRALMRQIADMKGSGIGVIGVADSTSGLAMLRTPLSSAEVSRVSCSFLPAYIIVIYYTISMNNIILIYYFCLYTNRQKH